MNRSFSWLRPTLFTLGGALAGLIYYNLAGCATGTCAITANPVNTMLYMGLIGFLISGLFTKGCSSGCNT